MIWIQNSARGLLAVSYLSSLDLEFALGDLRALMDESGRTVLRHKGKGFLRGAPWKRGSNLTGKLYCMPCNQFLWLYQTWKATVFWAICCIEVPGLMFPNVSVKLINQTNGLPLENKQVHGFCLFAT